MRILRLILTCCLLPCPGSMAENPGKSARPSFLFLLVDDLGWADLGCYGSTFHETPHLDRLAREGVRFTDAYTAASICSPTRASIMTGKHPVRVNITDWIPGSSGKGQKLQTPADKHHLPLEEVTIAEALKEGGYSTFYTGKWHLGGKPFSPDKQGFDEYYDPHQDPSKGSPGRGKTTGRKHATTDLAQPHAFGVRRARLRGGSAAAAAAHRDQRLVRQHLGARGARGLDVRAQRLAELHREREVVHEDHRRVGQALALEEVAVRQRRLVPQRAPPATQPAATAQRRGRVS